MIHRIFKQLAKALIRLRVGVGWSEPLLVAHTTLLEISCHGSILISMRNGIPRGYAVSQSSAKMGGTLPCYIYLKVCSYAEKCAEFKNQTLKKIGW